MSSVIIYNSAKFHAKQKADAEKLHAKHALQDYGLDGAQSVISFPIFSPGGQKSLPINLSITAQLPFD